jgi:hypothetical protein
LLSRIPYRTWPTTAILAMEKTSCSSLKMTTARPWLFLPAKAASFLTSAPSTVRVRFGCNF